MFGSKQKKHFIKRLGQNQIAIWDLGFERDKARAIREDLRRSYDKLKERVAMLEGQLPTVTDPKAKANIQASIDKYRPDLEHMESQLNAVHASIEDEGNPESMVNRMSAHVALHTMIKRYIRKL